VDCLSATGGQADGNETPVQTAVREAQEEVGLSPEDIHVLGQLPPVLSKDLLHVTPVLAWGLASTPLTLNKQEASTAPPFVLEISADSRDMELVSAMLTRRTLVAGGIFVCGAAEGLSRHRTPPPPGHRVA
jgi:8-oxo-dGTP pyrophosphatase MutT (NUDIX family)